ncbi:nucleotide-binding protein [Aeromicrobium sp. Root236]|uniref:nucleotide-binding protein n=1 Tax=Aeromicrobium sp. Root236 TaxID=1736498 RepID=UPI001F28CDC2|nr:nucleotide-binding protein [Aeromicrobium sp. Root236]
MSHPDPDALVFDTGPLRHFAVQGWLRVLDFLSDERAIVIPESVELELRHQSHELPVLNEVLNADWIHTDYGLDLEFSEAFARYEERLVGQGGANRGECGVLALGEVRGFEVVLDDAVARNVANEKGIRVTATVQLLCEAVRAEKLTVSMVEQLADDLISGDYYLPFERGEFRRYALENGLIEYQSP